MAEIRWTRVENVYPSYASGGGGHSRRCFRIGARNGARYDLPGPVVQLVPTGVRWHFAHVYKYQLSDDLLARWPHQRRQQFVVALDDGAFESYLSKRFGKIARTNMGAAKFALGVVMAKVSTRPVKMALGGKNAARTADRFTEVRVVDSGDAYTVRVVDSLSYAASALKGGTSAIGTAMKKAANGVAGRLRKAASAPLREQLRTPFPEVMRRRRAR